MDSQKILVRSLIAVATVAVAVLVLYPRAKERFEPTLERAWVAIQPEGAPAAKIGPVELDAGQPFTLHAVLEARSRDGSAVYYTDAPALEIAGRPVPAEALVRWDRPRPVKVFWYTIEGVAPFIPLDDAGQLDRFRYAAFFRPEWPATWSIPGRLDSANDDPIAEDEPGGEEGVPGEDGRRRTFGTQRYQVRIELFEQETDSVPTERYASLAADELPAAAAEFPTVLAALPGPAGPASLAFGLSQLEPRKADGPELLARLSDLTERHLAFARLPLLRDVFAAAGLDQEAAAWETIELDDGPPWQDGVGLGSLLRAGSRVVVLYADRGERGRLDRQDLCFDYERGAEVLALGEVFTGGGGVELARLTRR